MALPKILRPDFKMGLMTCNILMGLLGDIRLQLLSIAETKIVTDLVYQ